MQKQSNVADKKSSIVLDFMKANASSLIIAFSTFVVFAVIAFFDVASTKTVMSYSLSEYEVGQIADKTIIAEKKLIPTQENPVLVEKGEKITRKGFPITQTDYDKLKKIAETPSYVDYRSYANSLLYFVLLVALGVFLFSSHVLGRKIKPRDLIFIMSLFVISYAASIFGTKVPFFADPFNLPIIIPAVLSVMLIAVLVGEVESISFSIILTFAILQSADFNPVPALFVLCSTLSATRIIRKLEKRLDFIFASLLMAVLNVVFMFLLRVIFNDESNTSPASVFAIAINGFISGILALGFLTPLETLLNTASVFRLMDLSDLNSSMMRKMLLAAPGTYNHSMMVATLAETACAEIGANPLLARVGAYYHDIGKIEQPEYFVENQNGDNKHDEINPRLSVSVIRSHVKKGVEKATQMHFPKEVIDIIAQHHGNSVIFYFYTEAKKQDPNISPEEFSYIGTPPTTREAAVVMLADTVEAACHTLEKPTVPRLEKFISQLIMSKFEDGQLEKSPLTFHDLDVLKDAFVKILAGYYHSRIEYPNQKDPDEIDSEKNEQ